MQEFGVIKSLPENIWLSEGWFFWAFPRAQSALFLISMLNSFQGVLTVSSLQWSLCNLWRGSWQVPTSSQQDPFIATYLTTFGGHFMAIVSHGAGKAHSSSREDSIDRSLSVLLLDQALWAGKSLDHACLIILLVQENIPSCCFFPYLELHYYNHWSHGTAYQHFITGSVTHLLT